MPQFRFGRSAIRAVAVLLTIATPLLVAGCAATDSGQGYVADRAGSTVPNAAPAALSNGYPFGYW